MQFYIGPALHTLAALAVSYLFFKLGQRQGKMKERMIKDFIFVGSIKFLSDHFGKNPIHVIDLLHENRSTIAKEAKLYAESVKNTINTFKGEK